MAHSREYEQALFRSVSEQTRHWSDIDGVISVGVGLDEIDGRYFVRLVATKPVGELDFHFPDHLEFSEKEEPLPIRFEVSAANHTDYAIHVS
jgi:hypothetical protein